MAQIKKSGQLIAGLIVTAVGVMLMFERFANVDIYGVYRLWPLIVIAIGVARLVEPGGGEEGRRKRRRRWLKRIM